MEVVGYGGNGCAGGAAAVAAAAEVVIMVVPGGGSNGYPGTADPMDNQKSWRTCWRCWI